MSDQPKIKIAGREYDLPAGSFTFREMSLIKRVAGVRAAEVGDALKAGDTDLLLALAIIAMRRAGENVDEEKLLDMELGSIGTIGDDDDEEAGAGPPPEGDDEEGLGGS